MKNSFSHRAAENAEKCGKKMKKNKFKIIDIRKHLSKQLGFTVTQEHLIKALRTKSVLIKLEEMIFRQCIN